MRLLLILLLFTVCREQVCSQEDSLKKFKQRKLLLGIATGTTATVGSIGLYQAWYKDYNSGSFHTFNDNSEWLQMDKAGHTLTTFQIGNAGYHACKWSGMTEKKSILIGGTSGFAYMSIIEVMDGFSEGWGFSWADMGCNALGTGLFTTQQYFWKELRVKLKFSFHQSNYWQYRPQLLGENLGQQWLKDYNGQSYWLSVNPSSFMKEETKFPKWLNVAIGYGANGMISGHDDFVIIKSDGQVIGNKRYRRALLSLDVDLSRIKTKSKVLKAIFRTVNFIKVPFPALELSKGKVSGHWLYF